MRDNATSSEAQAEKWERATARDHYIAPADEAAWFAAAPDTYPDLCERCDGTGDGIGWDEWVCTRCGGTGIAP